MTFLSKGVCVPEEHVRSGIAPVTPGPDGQPYDWTQVTAGQLPRPLPETPAARRGSGCPVPRLLVLHRPDDVNSRAALAILEIVFALQESDGKSVGPLLTLPIGG